MLKLSFPGVGFLALSIAAFAIIFITSEEDLVNSLPFLTYTDLFSFERLLKTSFPPDSWCIPSIVVATVTPSTTCPILISWPSIMESIVIA